MNTFPLRLADCGLTYIGVTKAEHYGGSMKFADLVKFFAMAIVFFVSLLLNSVISSLFNQASKQSDRAIQLVETSQPQPHSYSTRFYRSGTLFIYGKIICTILRVLLMPPAISNNFFFCSAGTFIVSQLQLGYCHIVSSLPDELSL